MGGRLSPNHVIKLAGRRGMPQAAYTGCEVQIGFRFG
jgi:hypothetical protein